MTYSSGGLVQSTDYDGFVSTTSGANLNATWGTATTIGGYGQGNVAVVNTGDLVTATQWATLNNAIAAAASHNGTSITSRTNPVAGNVISVLSNINTDLTNIYNNRFNAASAGTQVANWTGTTSKNGTTGSGGSAWTITFTHTVTFANTTALYSFFNAGGRITIQYGKTSTGTPADTEWNAFVGNGTANGKVGTLTHTGIAASKTIASTSYTGLTKAGGTGTPTTLNTTIGVYALTGSNQVLYLQYDTGTPYTSNYVQTQASISGSTITYTTTWYDAGDSNPGAGANISGGTAPSGATFGTAPTTLVTYVPPETTYLTNSWGTPTVAATVA